MHIESTDCLIVIDVQNDFCPGGALEVPHGDEVVPVINSLLGKFAHEVMTQDWHPADHFSFASNHPGKSPFETTELDYGEQVLWPDHCVQGSYGAEFHPELKTTGAEMSLRKGYMKNIDSYSAFYENDRKTPTGLTGYLNSRGFQRVFLTGLATDFCVGYSAIDAAREGFEVYVIEDACRAIDLDGSLDRSKQDMHNAGVHMIDSTAL
ncbi:MAG: bifunctional nicotinamidase/pyrazinamidase [Arenicellales bacterium]|nr:bifunctional nicotinamidase/pyrazinamidase [Arenicellales bacterium]